MRSALGLEFVEAESDDLELLVSLRISAMKPSLVMLGRFDPDRARARFADSFNPGNTTKIYLSGEFVGFYVLTEHIDHVVIDHLYVKPGQQGFGIGAAVLERIKCKAISRKKPICVGALKKSQSNSFYKRHGFVKTHEGEWDIYYSWAIVDC